jgi:hypothetical protein
MRGQRGLYRQMNYVYSPLPLFLPSGTLERGSTRDTHYVFVVWVVPLAASVTLYGQGTRRFFGSELIGFPLVEVDERIPVRQECPFVNDV